MTSPPVQVQELPKEKRTLALQLALGELQMPEAFGMPSDPRLLFGGLNVEECKVMDSKKAPLFLSLRSVDLGSPAVPLLFKSGDDLRQDALVLQVTGCNNHHRHSSSTSPPTHPGCCSSYL